MGRTRTFFIPLGSMDETNYYTKGEIDLMIADFITNTVNDLVNYYTKSETYTQTEVNALIGNIQTIHFEFAASTSDVTDPQSNVIYLIGPTGSGSDKYEEYVYSNNTWTKIGDTSIDLTDYITSDELATTLNGYVTTTALQTALADYTPSARFSTVATSGAYADLTGTPTLATVATTGNYADLSGTPTIGTGTVTLTQNGATIGTFGLNDTDDKTIEIPAGGGRNDWYGSQAEFDALGTNLDTNTNYYINEINWTEIANRPTVPTKISELTNDSGYVTDDLVNFRLRHPDEKAIMKIVNAHNVYLTQAEYDQLGTNVDPDTNYHIEGDEQTLTLTFTLDGIGTVTYDVYAVPAQ